MARIRIEYYPNFSIVIIWLHLFIMLFLFFLKRIRYQYILYRYQYTYRLQIYVYRYNFSELFKNKLHFVVCLLLRFLGLSNLCYRSQNVQNILQKFPSPQTKKEKEKKRKKKKTKLGLQITQKTHKMAGVPHTCKFPYYFPYFYPPHLLV